MLISPAGIGRLATNLLLFYVSELAYVDLPEAATTGSSIMPQKRKPDVLELIRGRSAMALACLIESLGVCLRLPTGCNRDLQLIKAPLFRGIDICGQVLTVLPAVLAGLQFRPENIRLDASSHTTAQANDLVVRLGVAFREAYRKVAGELRVGRAGEDRG